MPSGAPGVPATVSVLGTTDATPAELAGTASGGDGALTLATDSGQRYAVPTPDAAARLRYDPSTARTTPAPFVRLLPAGPSPDPELAAKEYTGR